MSVGLIVGGILMVGLGVYNLAAALLPRHRLLHAGLWWRIGTGTGPSNIDRAWLAIVGIGLIAAAVYIVAVSR
jgi:hypothetical protein